MNSMHEELAAYQKCLELIEEQKMTAQNRAAELLEDFAGSKQEIKYVCRNLELQESSTVEAKKKLLEVLSAGNYAPKAVPTTPPSESVEFEVKLN